MGVEFEPKSEWLKPHLLTIVLYYKCCLEKIKVWFCFVLVRNSLCPFSQTEAKLSSWKKFCCKLSWCEKETEKPLSQLVSFKFLRKSTLFQRKTYAFNCDLCVLRVENRIKKNEHFWRKMYSFNFHPFSFLRMENRIEESRSHCVYFPMCFLLLQNQQKLLFLLFVWILLKKHL